MKFILISFLVSFTINLKANEHQSSDLSQFLSEFHNDTAKVMNQMPYKKGINLSLFSEEQIAQKEYVISKDKIRRTHCKEVRGSTVCLNQEDGRAMIESNDNIDDFIDNGADIIKNLNEIEKHNLFKKNLSVQPWSDDYWALAKGVLGKRYADPNKKEMSDWKAERNYVEENPVNIFLEQNLTDLLSPSEKYDLLVGDKEGTLTKSMWNEGKDYFDKDGKVESWMGICHGWAPAAFMAPRPSQKISVLAMDQKTVLNFYPSDIKGLTSLLWAKADFHSNFVGSRCQTKKPKKDRTSGRVLDQECFDSNPGTWHQVVINQIGVNDHSFVMDATFDYEVWNQPVYSYQFNYFNVETSETSTSWKKSAIPLAQYKNDPFKKFRSNLSTHIVGVEMSVDYVVETDPSHKESDSAQNDALSTVVYRYDLEVDSEGNIVGGEWYSNAHPDFLWLPAKDSKAQGPADFYTKGNWANLKQGDVYKNIPKTWAPVAPSASASGMPLSKVVEGLVKRSNAQ